MVFSGVRPEVLLVRDREEREEVEVEAADLARPAPDPDFPAPPFPELVTGVNIFLCVVLVEDFTVVFAVIVFF
jgi:hypothetical protein